MIEYINKYFNPLGAVNSFFYIFDIIDIKQASNKPVVTLKAWFSQVFASLKMGGVDIGLALQVGFMLSALLSWYSTVVTDFCLGCHSLTCATLQTIVEHWTSYNKHPWTGPVGHDGRRAHSSLANTASANPNNTPAAYNTMEQVSFNYHLSHWQNSLSDLADKCVICHSLAWEKKHATAKCPILKKLGLELKKRLAVDNSIKFAAQVIPKGSSTATPPPVPTPAPVSNTGGGFNQNPRSLHGWYWGWDYWLGGH
jgi:hypothetical protein